MKLSPREQQKLMTFTAAEVARRRGRGLKLEHPEADALVSAEFLTAPATAGASRS